ncbi:MAG: hypothetical protein J7639_18385 [Paenibacillaceae bacterium]|nr:hypothetical protein [Paenibacillaceae bacterium]
MRKSSGNSKPLRCLIVWLTAVLALVVGFSGFAATGLAAPAPPPPERPTGLAPPDSPQGPEFRWLLYQPGDSPVNDAGVFDWTRPGATRDWARMPFISGAGEKREYIWFAGMLPAAPPDKRERDPYLLFVSVSYAFEVYSGERLLFRHGDMTGGRGTLQTGTPVLVPLAELAEGQPLLLRVHSQRDTVLAGKIGPVMYGSQASLKLMLIEKDSMNAVLLLLFFIIGLVSLLLHFINRDNPANLYFAGFVLTICCNQLLSLRTMYLFVDYSTINLYVREPLQGCSMFLFACYILLILRPVWAGFIRAVGRTALAAGLLMPVVKLSVPQVLEQYGDTISDAKRLAFSLLCAVCLFVFVRSLGNRHDSDAKWFLSGFSFYLIANMAGHPLRLYLEANIGRFALKPVEFVQMLNACMEYSLLFSTFFLAVISIKRYAGVYRATRRYIGELASLNRTLESKVEERTRSIQRLLDHAGQGFLTIDGKLEVGREISLECLRMFGRDIVGARYVELLYPTHAAEQELHEEMIQSAFHGDDLQREVCLSLLPGDALVNGKHLALQYKWIPESVAASGNVMVILTDISERRQMESQIAKERRVLHMIVWVIKHFRDFKELLEEYRLFAQKGMGELAGSRLPFADKWTELYRIIHTFKGNFAQLDFTHTTDKLHEFESRLTEWKQHVDGRDPEAGEDSAERFAEWLGGFDLLAWLEEDVRILRDILGDRFDIGQHVIAIELARLRSLEQQIYAVLPSPEAAAIVTELKKLRYRSLKDLLGMYPEYAHRLAARSGKELYPVKIAGGDRLVDPDLYAEFARTLIHVFRNMVDHGIEIPEQRASAGKDRLGTILCEFTEEEQEMVLRLSNDGSAMDLSAIRIHAVTRGLCSPEEVAAMPEEEQRMLVFRDGFSTKQIVTGLSGRGVGLSAVRKALERLNGTIRVESSEEGTSFHFVIPLPDATHEWFAGDPGGLAAEKGAS